MALARGRTSNSRPINRDLKGNRKCYNCDYFRIREEVAPDETYCMLQDKAKLKHQRCIMFEWNPELNYIQGPPKDVEVEDFPSEDVLESQTSHDTMNPPRYVRRPPNYQPALSCPSAIVRKVALGVIAGIASVVLLKKVL